VTVRLADDLDALGRILQKYAKRAEMFSPITHADRTGG